MEIRHRKQFLTGKMILQQRGFDGNLVDAREDHADLLNRLSTLISDSDTEIAVLREENDRLCSQLSEALNKLREYRDGNPDVRKVPRDMDVYIVPKDGGYALKIRDSSNGVTIYWSDSSTKELMFSNIPTPIRRILAKRGQIPPEYDNDTPTCGEKAGLETKFYVDYQIDPVGTNLKQGFVSGEELREALEQFGRQCTGVFKDSYEGIYQRLKLKMQFMTRTGAGIGEADGRTDDELRPLKDRLIEAGCIPSMAALIATAYDRNPPWGTKAEQVLIEIVRKGQFSREEFLMLLECAPWVFQSVRDARDAFDGIRKGSLSILDLVAQMWEPDEQAQPIPHHGPGLSEAEDAMRDGAWHIDLVGPGLKHPTDEPVQPLKSQPLRLILERVGNTSRIYYRVQDRITCINKHQGIADSIEAAIECIPAEDRARIAEERRYGMGVGE